MERPPLSAGTCEATRTTDDKDTPGSLAATRDSENGVYLSTVCQLVLMTSSARVIVYMHVCSGMCLQYCLSVWCLLSGISEFLYFPSDLNSKQRLIQRHRAKGCEQCRDAT